MATLKRKAGRKTKNDHAKALKSRYEALGSWQSVSRELGYNRGVLCGVANGKRQPSHSLIDRMNEIYHLRLPYPSIKMDVTPCSRCGQLHEFRKRCPSQPKRARRKYDISFKRLRELMNSPYSQS